MRYLTRRNQEEKGERVFLLFFCGEYKNNRRGNPRKEERERDGEGGGREGGWVWFCYDVSGCRVGRQGRARRRRVCGGL